MGQNVRSEDYYTVAVSGTHGKSTTTKDNCVILVKAGLGPTVFLGTKKPSKSNFALSREGLMKERMPADEA